MTPKTGILYPNIAEQQNTWLFIFLRIKTPNQNPKMELSKNITISNGIFGGERRIRLHYRMEPKTKNISFSVNEWISSLRFGGDKQIFQQGSHRGRPDRENLGSNPRGSGRKQESDCETI